MTRIRVVLTTILLTCFAAFAYAHEPRDEPKPPEHQQQKPEPQSEKNEAKPQNDERRQNEKPPREEAKPGHQEHNQAAQGGHSRPAGKSAHIPDAKFHSSFGRQHTFVINRPVIVEGQPRFQYAGYWFVFVDPWPAEWLYTDDVFVDYVDGDYFLFDVLHPGFRIALFVMD